MALLPEALRPTSIFHLFNGFLPNPEGRAENLHRLAGMALEFRNAQGRNVYESMMENLLKGRAYQTSSENTQTHSATSNTQK